jgi:hypothetical protein
MDAFIMEVEYEKPTGIVTEENCWVTSVTPLGHLNIQSSLDERAYRCVVPQTQVTSLNLY